jgi:hypothetical protein
MTTQAYKYAQTKKPDFTLERLIAVLFAVEWREAIDKDTGGDKSDAAYTWGL